MYPSCQQLRRRCAAALLVITLSNAACAAWHVEGVPPDSVLPTRHPRAIRVTRADSSRIVLWEPLLRADTLYGLASGNRGDQQQVQVPVADVRQLETLGFSPGRTVGLFAGLAGVVLATIAIAFAIACRGGACST
jgi:hypothetical protein